MCPETCGSFSKIGEIIASLYVTMGNPLERKTMNHAREEGDSDWHPPKWEGPQWVNGEASLG